MPVSHAFDGRIVVIKMDGDYTTAELKAGVLAALDDATCPADAVLMFDMRTSAAIKGRTPAEVQDMANFLATQGPRFSKRLAMVTGTDVAFGLMRLGSVYAERGGLFSEVFREIEEAKKWLVP
ncbi:MAG TPA: hypothetical protein VI160_10845 [Gemmatimonadales bacterium]